MNPELHAKLKFGPYPAPTRVNVASWVEFCKFTKSYGLSTVFHFLMSFTRLDNRISLYIYMIKLSMLNIILWFLRSRMLRVQTFKLFATF